MPYGRFFSSLLILSCLKMATSDEGGTGHFQVHNEQEGSLKIHATKEIAQIETQANSVQVVLEPGKVNAPVEEHKGEGKGKIRKVVQIIDPMYMAGLKKSTINRIKKDKQAKSRLKRALIEGVKTFENSIMLAEWTKENGRNIKSNLKRKHFIKRRSVANARRYKKENLKSKKSEISKETRVHGRTGGLHVTTGKHGTKLISKGGALNVFIKNEKEDETKTIEEDNSERRSFEDNSKYHVINSDLGGLSLKRSIVIKRRTRCIIPPCVP